MRETIEIDTLDLVNNVIIPMQNLSQTLKSILEGKNLIPAKGLVAGLRKVQANSEMISWYLSDLKDEMSREPTLRLSKIIRKIDSENRASIVSTEPQETKDFLLAEPGSQDWCQAVAWLCKSRGLNEHEYRNAN